MENYKFIYVSSEVSASVARLDNSAICGARRTNFFSLGLRNILIWVGAIALGACSNIPTFRDSEPVSVMINGVHHLGPNFNIGEFYINDKYASNIGRNGGGASDFCCTSLPRKWRPGLVAKVQWSVNDWSKAVRSEMDAGNYKSVSYQNYVAIAPIEKYEEVGDLYPHFFKDGKVRLISSNYPVNNSNHPIREDDPSAIELATSGEKIKKR